MEIKLVAVDLDDTLLNSKQKIEKGCYEALWQVRRQGIMVVLATGRMMRSAVVFADNLKLDTPIIAYQGAWVKKKEAGDFLYCRNLAKDTAAEVIDFLESQRIYYHIYAKDDLYVKEITKWVDFYRASGIEPVVRKNLASLVDEVEITEIMAAVEADASKQEIISSLHGKWGENLHVSSLKNRYIEIMHREANKAEALKAICRYYGIEREKVMAIGDGYNDIPMLKWAGIGIAMGNAPLEVKRAADYVTLSHDECGVAYALQKWVVKG